MKGVTRVSLFESYKKLCKYDSKYLHKYYYFIISFTHLAELGFFFFIFRDYLLNPQHRWLLLKNSNYIKIFIFIGGYIFLRSSVENSLYQKSFDEKFPGKDKASFYNIDIIL